MGQAPRPARDALVPLLLRIHRLGIEKRPTRGSAADVGVRPTIYADARKWENYAALTREGAVAGGGFPQIG